MYQSVTRSHGQDVYMSLVFDGTELARNRFCHPSSRSLAYSTDTGVTANGGVVKQ